MVARQQIGDEDLREANIWKLIQPTADVHAAVESLGNLGVHLDQEILLPSQVFVASCDLILDPGAEGLSDDRVGHVDEPLPRHLVHVAVFRKVVADLWGFPGALEYALNAEVLVLRDVEHLDVVALDAASILVRKAETYYLRLPVTRSFKK